MKHQSLSKVLKRLACVLAALVIALAVAVFALWHNELATLSSLKKLSDRDEAHRDGAVYQLNVSGGYYFDDFLAQGGASTDSELISFITQSITKGIIPMNIKTSTIACSAFTADTQSGDRVFGRNYDFSATNTAIVYTNPGKGRHASYSTIDLSFLGLDKDRARQSASAISSHPRSASVAMTPRNSSFPEKDTDDAFGKAFSDIETDRQDTHAGSEVHPYPAVTVLGVVGGLDGVHVVLFLPWLSSGRHLHAR